MHMSRLARRRRQLGALVAGLCLAAGSVGTAALADSGSGTTISVEASVMVQAGMSPLQARQAATNLNSAIDSAARGLARSAAGAISAGRPVRTSLAATRTFTNRVDAALTGFAVQTVDALADAGTATRHLTSGTLTALNQVLATLPGAVAADAGATVSVASGADGTTVSAQLNPVIDTALRQSIRGSIQALRPVLPLSRATVRVVAGGVRQVVDASVVAVNEILAATADFTVAVLNVTGTTLLAIQTVTENAVARLNTIVAAVDATLDNLSDVNLTAAVDASLQVSSN